MPHDSPPGAAPQPVVAFALRHGFRLLRALGPRRASTFVGTVTRFIGLRLPVSKVADRNLQRALPDLDAAARRRIVGQVWETIGRNVGELPQLDRFRETATGPGWELIGRENLPPGPAIFFSAHFGNWEMILPVASQLGLKVSGFYRRASNRAVEEAIQAQRMAALGPHVRMFAKGAGGARDAFAHLARGGSLGLLIDQKMNDGIAAPFFGRPAMTAPAAAQFALRFGLPLVPMRVERLGNARFRVVCEPALALPRTGARASDILALTTAMNATVEGWIRGDPGAWLWLHKRWPKDEAPGAADRPAVEGCPAAAPLASARPLRP
jgi:KDO2-lipid IV(A) lauroyltransferase